MKPFEPMLAATLVGSLENIRYPALFSPKLDGYRAVVIGGQLMSRNLKPIPNKELRARYSKGYLEGLDGELITGVPWSHSAFNTSSRVVRNANADASDTGFYVFDLHNVGGKFADRFAQLTARVSLYGLQPKLLWPVKHELVTNPVMAEDLKQHWLEMGYEGAMARDPNGEYKNGRSTMREQGLVKIKDFLDAEAYIIDCIEERQNTNANDGDAFGRAKRSTKKAGMVGKNTLGGFLVRGSTGVYKDRVFRCGTGVLTDEQCAALWQVRGDLINREFTYKYFPTGSVEAPRFPLFLKAPWLADLIPAL